MRLTPTTNAGSMADIAFTLLIFFLVSTTLATDKGERVKLPIWDECEDCILDIQKKDLFSVLINANNELIVEDKPFEINNLTAESIRFLLNNNEDPLYSTSYKTAIIYLQTHENVAYEKYLEVFSHIKAAFKEIRNNEALSVYGLPYKDLTDNQAIEIRKTYPLKIAEKTIID